MSYDSAYAPYAENYASTSSSLTDLDFTGQFQDTMAGLYDFLYREYDSVQGRWVSPDPAGLGVVDPANPQTWNRYAYVMNNPLSAVDPLGLGECVWDTRVHDCPDADGGPIWKYLGAMGNCRLDGAPIDCHSLRLLRQGGATHLSLFICENGDCGYHFFGDPAMNGLLSKLKNLIPRVCGGGGFGYGGAGGHRGAVHGEILGLVEYDSRLGGAHGGLVGAGAGNFTGGVESMRTWNDWQAHTTPIGLGGIEIPGATSAFGKNINTQSKDIGGLAQYEKGNLSLGLYGGLAFGSGRAFGGGGYLTLSWSGCHE